MDSDLLGDEQTSNTEHALTESLDGLCLIDSATESQEVFGDYIQGSAWKPWATQPATGSSHSNGKRQLPPAALSLEKSEFSTAGSDVLLPYIPLDLIPPPPMSATPPRTNLPHQSSSVANSVPISRRNTAQKPEVAKSALEIAADQVLDWLSPIQPKPKSDSATKSISGAWESALGLMDGDQPGVHIAEITRRLCGVLDTLPTLSVSDAVIDTDVPGTTFDIDSWTEPAYETSAGGSDKQQRGRREQNIDLRITKLVWPELVHSADSTKGENSSDNLVAAYLRLAEMSNVQEDTIVAANNT
ncbi:hypothetical protein H4S07_001698 [Coemansia furcata]|uniref:Uncharacterized protein n=1 Tax=Coemansia furcata TaxID=417177 RepID=A0ACC1LM75_9FUNG|nr:hypothetical protein H4S07_001698 [Coemansia furcata]